MQENFSDENWSYEWDEAKREINFSKHGIDFWDVLDVFESPHLMIRSDRIETERSAGERWVCSETGP